MTIRIHVDPERCQGHGRCYMESPSVYDADEEGYAVSGEHQVADDLLAEARRGADRCPERAITIRTAKGREP